MLGEPQTPVSESSKSFQDSIAGMTSASAVADLEVVSRGRELIDAMGPAFLDVLVHRSTWPDPASPEDMAACHGRLMEVQVELQVRFSRLVAAVRRDIGIKNSSDREVSLALNQDGAAIIAKAEKVISRIIDNG